MTYHTADHALERYLRLRATLSDVRGQDVSLGSGWADECARTGCSGERRESHGEMRCGRCGDLWTFRPPALVRSAGRVHREPRGEVASWARRDARRGLEAQPSGTRAAASGVGAARRLHGRLSELALLGVVLCERPGGRRLDPATPWRMSARAWEAHLAVWLAYVTGPDGYAALADRYRPELLRVGERPDERGASAAVNRARDVVEARLDWRGLLAPRVRVGAASEI